MCISETENFFHLRKLSQFFLCTFAQRLTVYSIKQICELYKKNTIMSSICVWVCVNQREITDVSSDIPITIQRSLPGHPSAAFERPSLEQRLVLRDLENRARKKKKKKREEEGEMRASLAGLHSCILLARVWPCLDVHPASACSSGSHKRWFVVVVVAAVAAAAPRQRRFRACSLT